ncbi:MAG: class I SAM-dependent methyltransferase [Anaerolineales bacterium]|nr:class I SAM-dependent methyltransferase [Anaerolineales bacterium]
MPIFDHFGFLAPLYDRIFRPSDPKTLIDRLELPVSGALLDAGGGTGRIAQLFSGMADPIIVADLSHPMLTQTRGKNGLRPVCAHTERLPFPDGFFDRILMVDALHHVCDQRRTALELWRALAPGGRLVIEEPDLRSFGVKLLSIAERLALMRSRILAPQQIADLFRFDGARVRIEAENHIVWIIVEKP